ncbi:MAG: hypothetical protein V3T70_07795 [Phycisphaerae bacterium]
MDPQTLSDGLDTRKRVWAQMFKHLPDLERLAQADAIESKPDLFIAQTALHLIVGELQFRSSPQWREFVQDRHRKLNVLIPISPLPIAHEGLFDLVVLADGQEIDRQQFGVIRSPQPGPSTEPHKEHNDEQGDD